MAFIDRPRAEEHDLLPYAPFWSPFHRKPLPENEKRIRNQKSGERELTLAESEFGVRHRWFAGVQRTPDG